MLIFTENVFFLFLLIALNIVEIMTLNVQGEIGGKVSFTCSNWNIWFSVTTNNKYLCESPCSDKKHIIITAAPGKTKHQNRVILKNKGNDFLVTFNNLKLVDSKKYYCGVERLASDPLIEINLKVVHSEFLFFLFFQELNKTNPLFKSEGTYNLNLFINVCCICGSRSQKTC